MLLPLLTITALLIGGWTFAAMLSAWASDYGESAQPSVSPRNRQVSLWSLVLLLFFPSNLAPPSPSPSLPLRDLD